MNQKSRRSDGTKDKSEERGKEARRRRVTRRERLSRTHRESECESETDTKPHRHGVCLCRRRCPRCCCGRRRGGNADALKAAHPKNFVKRQLLQSGEIRSKAFAGAGVSNKGESL